MSQYYNGSGGSGGGAVSSVQGTAPITVNGVSGTPETGAVVVAIVGTITKYAVTTVDHAMSAYTVLTSDQYLAVDCSGGVVTLKFPNAPSTGQYWIIKDSTGSAASNNITITTVGGSVDFDGQTSLTINANYTALLVLFDGSNYEIF